MTDIDKTVIELAAKQVGLDPKQVTRDHAFVADLGYDSLEMVELTMKLEETFDIRIPDESADSIRTVGEAADAVKHRLENPCPAP